MRGGRRNEIAEFEAWRISSARANVSFYIESIRLLMRADMYILAARVLANTAHAACPHDISMVGE